jgi:hypothetical protein
VGRGGDRDRVILAFTPVLTRAVVEVSADGETVPGRQWTTVGREPRRRLAVAFAEDDIPFSG